MRFVGPRLAASLIVVGLAGCGESSQLPTPDVGPEPSDGGPILIDAGPATTLSVHADFAIGRAAGMGGVFGHRAADGPRFVFGMGTEAHQGSGASRVDLPGRSLLVGRWNTGTEGYDWSSISERDSFIPVGGAWYHLPTGEQYVDGRPVNGPALVELHGVLGVVPVPAGLEQLWVLGDDGEGTTWIQASADGSTVIDGRAIGESGEPTFFVARVRSEGLTHVRVVGTGLLDSRLFLLASGDVAAATVASSSGTFGATPVEFGDFFFTRFDPAVGPAGEPRIDASMTNYRLSVQGDGLELVTVLRDVDGPITIGDYTYEPLGTPRAETWVRIGPWDGTSPFPRGERWPLPPGSVDDRGVALHQGFDGVGVFTRLTPDREVAVTVRAEPESSSQWRTEKCGASVCVAHLSTGEPGTLSVRRGGEAGELVLDPAAPGRASVIFAELSVETGELLRQRAFAFPPETSSDRRFGDATALDEDHVLVMHSTTGGMSLQVHRWDGGAPLEVPVEVSSGCTVGTSVPDSRNLDGWAPDPGEIHVSVECESAPHEVEVGGASFRFGTSASRSLFRIAVE